MIDSTVMRINYKFTTSFLILSSCIVTAHSWFGGKKPIDCFCNEDPDKPEKCPDFFINDYCWIHPKNINTHSSQWTDGVLDNRLEGIVFKDSDRTQNVEKLTDFYAWTPFFFLFQAVFFYTTRFIWYRWEGGIMRFFKKTLDSAKSNEEKAKLASEVIIERTTKNFNDLYSFGYCFCEAFSLGNIIVQIFVVNNFLGGDFKTDQGKDAQVYNFLTLGLQFIKSVMAKDAYIVPLRMMFPRQSTCRFTKMGGGGRMTATHARCLLTLNIIHDKVMKIIGIGFI